MIPGDRGKLWKVGLGAGIMGGVFIALRYALRPAAKGPLPESISPAIFATRVFQTSLGQIVYHESGTGQPVLFVHGVCTGASSYEWSKVYPALAINRRIIALDLIGFGESERPPGRHTAADHVRSLAEFIRGTCGNARPIMVGSGLGGGFCAQLAAQHPELVDRLVLLMPTGLTEFGRRHLPVGMDLASRVPILNRFLYRDYLSRRASVRAWLARYGLSQPERVTQEMEDVFTTCAQQYGAEHAIFNLLGGRLNVDLEAMLARAPQPITLLWGDRSAYPPLEWGRRLQETVRAANLTVLHDTGTLAALEAPDALVEILKRELDNELRVIHPA